MSFMDNPTQLYNKTVESMRTLLDKEGEDAANRAFAEAISAKRHSYFTAGLGLRERKGHACFHRLLGKRCPGKDCLSPFAVPGNDHTTELVSNNQTTAIFAQPYGLAYQTIKELVTFCDEQGLEVNVDAHNSWHFPGRTIGLTYIKKMGL